MELKTFVEQQVEVYSNNPSMASIYQRGEHDDASHSSLGPSLLLKREILEAFYMGASVGMIVNNRELFHYHRF